MSNQVEKKVDLKKIIKDLESKFGKDNELSDIEKARFLYLELGKLFRYNGKCYD